MDTILRLRDQYRDDIEIHLGLEAEYYPEIWEGLLKLIEPYPIEYLLLGQHYIHNEYEGDRYNGKPGHSDADLLLYCSQCKEALETGRSVYDLVLEKGLMTREKLDEALDPKAMTASHDFLK